MILKKKKKKKKKKNFDTGTLVIDPARLTDGYMAEEEQNKMKTHAVILTCRSPLVFGANVMRTSVLSQVYVLVPLGPIYQIGYKTFSWYPKLML